MIAAVASTLVGLVLLLAGFAKLVEPAAAQRAFANLHLPRLAIPLALAEGILGAVLVSGIYRWPATAAALALLTAMTAALVRLRELGVGCACFGGASGRAADTGDIARNAFLILMAALGIVLPAGGAPRAAVLLTAGALVLAGILGTATVRTVRSTAPLAREIRGGLRDVGTGTGDLSARPLAGEPERGPA